jgi:hypothetical protein
MFMSLPLEVELLVPVWVVANTNISANLGLEL